MQKLEPESVADAAAPRRMTDTGPKAYRFLRRLPSELSGFAVVSVAVAAFFALLAFYPLCRVVLRLFINDAGEFDLTAFGAIFTQDGVGLLLINTIIVVAASAVLALIIGSIMAWINERTDARMGLLTDVLPLLPFLVPPIAGAIGWVLLLSDRSGLLNAVLRWALMQVGIELATGPLNIYSWPGLIFVYTIYAVPYVYLLVSAGLKNVDSALEEQSRICGSGLLRTMRLVTIPAVRPSLGAALMLLVWFGFALFSIPAILGRGAHIEVLSVRLVNLMSFTYPPQTARAIGLGMIVIFVVGLAWLLQGRILKSGRFATVGGKGHKINRIELGAWKAPARALVILYIFIAAALPVIALLLVALNGFWTPQIRWTHLNLSSFREILFDDGQTAAALKNSLSLGIVGATLGITAAAVIALYMQRVGGPFARVLDAMIKLPASISTIVLAIGFVLAFSGPPFNLNGTYTILLLAYLALYMPQASIAADAAAAQVGRELTEASRISGASGGRTLWRVNLPLMVTGLAAGWALLFVRMISDLTASSILAGTNNTVVGFRILEVYLGGSFANLAALSTVLTLVSLIVIIPVLIFSKRKVGPAASI
jgi:iron(III) transport system permease protein